MAMNQDTTAACEPKEKMSIASDSDYWESEFRNVEKKAINVATPLQVI